MWDWRFGAPALPFFQREREPEGWWIAGGIARGQGWRMSEHAVKVCHPRPRLRIGNPLVPFILWQRGQG